MKAPKIDMAINGFSVIFVLSLPTNFERRIQMRKDLLELKSDMFKVVFILGKSKTENQSQLIDNEARQFGGKINLFLDHNQHKSLLFHH